MNKNDDVTQDEHLQQWSNKAVVSLSASLVFGRERASEIAQPLLIALFSLTANDYEKDRVPLTMTSHRVRVRRTICMRTSEVHVCTNHSLLLMLMALSQAFLKKV